MPAGLLQRFFRRRTASFSSSSVGVTKRHTQRRMVWLIAVEKFARHKYYAVT